MGKRNKNKIPLIRFTDIENTRITAVKLPDEVLKVLGIDKDDEREDYGKFLNRYLTKPKYMELYVQFQKYIHDSMPKEVKAKCKYCSLGESTKDEDKICNGYVWEGKGNFFLVGNEFYRIYLQNKHLFKDEKQIRYLCYVFFSCFSFYKGKVYFDFDNLLKECLKEGLKSISKLLQESDVFRRMQIINNSIHDLKNQQLKHQIDHDYKDEYIQFQIKHYKEAKRFYTEKEELETKYSLENNPLRDIWLAEAKLSIKDLLQLGIDKGMWNEKYEIFIKKGSVYGTGKTFLANLAHALKGHSISEETDYKVIGKAFCEQFNIEPNANTKEPYKTFNKENKPIKDRIKKAFSIK